MKIGDLVVYCYYGKRSLCDIFEGYDRYGNLVMVHVAKDKLRQGIGIIVDSFSSYAGSPRPFARVQWIETPEILQQSYERGHIPTVDLVAQELLGPL